MTDFTYDIKAEFAAGEVGFDALRISTGSAQTEFKELEVDGVTTDPAGVAVEDDGFVVQLPQRISSAHNPDLRVTFARRSLRLCANF